MRDLVTDDFRALVPMKRPPVVWSRQRDDELEEHIRWALRRERRLEIAGLQVSVRRGRVTVAGRVRSPEQCMLALLIARRVPDVRRIINRMVIRPEIFGPSWN